MKTKYGWNTAYELPLGGRCRYYLNDSTLIGTSTSLDNNVTTNTSLFGSHRLDSSYEIYDGTLIAKNIVYCVHDEASGLPNKYFRKYENLEMKYIKGDNTQYLSKCIGGGSGLNGECIINKCIFSSDFGNEVSYHGHTKSDISKLTVKVYNSYFLKGLQLDTIGKNEVATLIYCGNSATITPIATNNWKVKAWCNEQR